MSEAELKCVQAAAGGDRMAFRQIVLEHSRALFAVAWRMVHDEALAEDIVQEAFIKAWRYLGEFRMESSLRSWLHRITVNCAMDALRKRARRNEFETDPPAFESADRAVHERVDMQIDIGSRASAAMRKLSDTERAALMLRHFEGHSIREIAQMLEITTEACKQTIFRAVKKMRVELQPLVT